LKIKIVSDGSIANTRVIDQASGEALEDVSAFYISADATCLRLTVNLIVTDVALDISSDYPGVALEKLRRAGGFFKDDFFQK
jgi:hypothetical protein